MKKTKLALWGVVALIVVFVASTFAYYLPSTVKVTISGTEVKRHEIDESGAGGRTRDVRYIQTRDIESGKARVFRNEDTGWGWPPYFKFDSGDLAGEAANIAKKQPDAVVLVTYYGVRSTMLSLYPNALSLEVVERDATHVPWFNIIFFVLLGAALIASYVFVRRLRRRITGWWQRRGGGS